jgi:hypothetical protein
MRSLIRNTVFFIGWALSPLTFWNDAFVNIPVSYFMANVMVRFVNCDFIRLLLVLYWFTNVAGLVIMYAAGKDIGKGRAGVVKGVISLIITTAVYSFIIIALGKLGIIRPT